jgi:hypothetical protein
LSWNSNRFLSPRKKKSEPLPRGGFCEFRRSV